MKENNMSSEILPFHFFPTPTKSILLYSKMDYHYCHAVHDNWNKRADYIALTMCSEGYFILF